MFQKKSSKPASLPFKDDVFDFDRFRSSRVDAFAVVSAADVETSRVVGSAGERAARYHACANGGDENGC